MERYIAKEEFLAEQTRIPDQEEGERYLRRSLFEDEDVSGSMGDYQEELIKSLELLKERLMQPDAAREEM